VNRTERFWDRQAENYAKQQQNVELNKNKDFVSTIKYLNVDNRVLDYGCGAGIVSNAIADRVKEVQAIDISSKMVEVAKKKASELNIKNVSYTQANIFDERFQKESFNIILAFRVLHLVEDIQAVMHRINELLQPGGSFISVTGCLGERKAFLGIMIFLLSKLRVFPQNINMFKLPELEGFITIENFQIVENEKLNESLPHYFIVARKL
jgi:ubiquinone biosynthesis O-methyltransferase